MVQLATLYGVVIAPAMPYDEKSNDRAKSFYDLFQPSHPFPPRQEERKPQIPNIQSASVEGRTAKPFRHVYRPGLPAGYVGVLADRYTIRGGMSYEILACSKESKKSKEGEETCPPRCWLGVGVRDAVPLVSYLTMRLARVTYRS